MARLARIVVPGVPHHVVQRARAGMRLFPGDADYLRYLELLEAHATRQGVVLLCSCLMPDHVHLVAVPAAAESLARALGETRRLFARHRGLGAEILWRGRFQSCPLDEAHARAAIGYICFNPVRAGLAPSPGAWKWLTCAAMPDHPPDEGHAEAIRAATRTGRPAGGADFYARLEYDLGRTLRPRRRGRKARW